jgi:hypothetical protein
MPGKAHAVAKKRTQEKVFGIIGILIAFSTYVFKENKRDHLRELIDSIAAETGRFTLSLPNEANAYTLAGLARGIDNIDRYLKWSTTKTGREPDVPIAMRTVGLAWELRRYEFDLRHTVDLLNTLPYRSEALTSKVSAAQAQLESLKAEVDNFTAHVQEDQAEAEEARISGLFEDFYRQVETVSEDVLEEANKEKEELEKSFSVFGNVSNILICLGLGVAVYGKLMGYGTDIES